MATSLPQRAQKVTYTGPLKIVEMTGGWGVYAGERIIVGEGRSFRDDLGIRLRELFQEGAADALKTGKPLAESFEIDNVRITIEILD